MADTINELTLKLTRYFLDQIETINAVSISGFIAYLTLLLLNAGLQGQSKYDLSNFLDCNYSYLEFSFAKNVFEYECINFLTMAEFMTVGKVKSAIFHSKPIVETFKRIANEIYGIEVINIDPVWEEHQRHAINEWAKSIVEVPFHYILFRPFNIDLRLLIINEYLVRFKWFTPANKGYTRYGTFTNANSRPIKVRMMRMVDMFHYHNDSEIKASVVFVKLETDGIFGRCGSTI
ncbi:hypothetical protein RF11_09913 [Thelohanellus kitauei]|uniref:Serpin domain-containing protein n=1 Tax=Thelohanellus kitauei TaxID=669202 RepID=A0A0C2ISX3_THEKT|nr:hypothetical protein RF11_09913 [Thelohanellus kitauei]